MVGPPAITTARRRGWCWRQNMAATAARRSVTVTNSSHRSPRSPLTGRRTISKYTKGRSSRKDTKAARSSLSMARGTARLAPKADTIFQPLSDGKAFGDYIVFADGFAGKYKEPGRAAHRPSGLAIGPDGALYITDDKAGRVWRVTYSGDPNSPIEAAPTPSAQAEVSPNALPPEGVHPDAATSANLPIPPGATPEQVALGKRIFHGEASGGTCAGCHGADGVGTPVGPALASGTWLWGNGSLQSITGTIRNGVPQPKQHPGAMPPSGGVRLSDSDLAAVADYVWAIGHQNKQ
jgi:mono/diheme cytochrome c family protein